MSIPREETCGQTEEESTVQGTRLYTLFFSFSFSPFSASAPLAFANFPASRVFSTPRAKVGRTAHNRY